MCGRVSHEDCFWFIKKTKIVSIFCVERKLQKKKDVVVESKVSLDEQFFFGSPRNGPKWKL